ncbi:MAG: hypothetical protein Q9217_006129 [Psora testacea]
MFRGGSKGFRRGRGTHGTVTKVPLKGLFSDGIWKCNCDPRLPALHLQTKNGGKNHGRWFNCAVYTCQLPQPKRCDFFLWDDEAKGREAAAVLNNSRMEPLPQSTPVTPSKVSPYGLPTPQTERRGIDLSNVKVQTPYTPSKTARSAPKASLKGNADGNTTQRTASTAGSSDEEFYDWPASDDDEMGKVADLASSNQSSAQNPPLAPPETPRKAVKLDVLSTPGKRRYDETTEGTAPGGAWPTPATEIGKEGDVFTTPSMKTNGNLFSTNHPSPAETPTPIRYKDLPPSQDSELTTEILTLLQGSLSTPLSTEVRENIKNICNKHVMYTRGIMKGRDVSRAIVKKKDEKIGELEGELEGLRSQRETDRAVIKHLRRDTAQRGE